MNRIPLFSLLAALWFYAVVPLSAGNSYNYAVDLKATISTIAPCIVLSWTQRVQASITAQNMYRRLKGETTWNLVSALSTTQSSYADMTAVPGVEYEYWMLRNLGGYTATGYISAGVQVPEVHQRGKLLLVIESSRLTPLAKEIAQLKLDLMADGWTVVQITVATTSVPATKALITAAYNADPANVKMVYLLGHVPVPYSGDIAPDGHGDHMGAWPADGYYGDMDGIWTDSTVSDSVAADTRNRNVPGDGKFDQTVLPSKLELQVGRVDLIDLPYSPDSTYGQAALLSRYMGKAHDYRYKQGAYASIPRRTLICDSLDYGTTGWAAAYTCVGPAIDSISADQWFTSGTVVGYADKNTYLWGYGSGYGGYLQCAGVGLSWSFGNSASRVVFTALFGSYFGDWDEQGNLMRSVIAGNAVGTSLGLTCFWSGRPNYFMHPMGMGETIGYATRLTQNGGYVDYDYGESFVHTGLMGDPALRMHMVSPARNLVSSRSSTSITLGWDASTEAGLQGYHVYRAATSDGPFVRLTTTPVVGNTYTDTSVVADQNYIYMVRVLKLESVPGGSYYNLSLGSFVTPPSLPTPALTSAVSRLIHGKAGTFDLLLPSNGPVAIEPRRKTDLGNYRIIFNFAGTVSGITATLGLQSGQIGSAKGSAGSVSYDATHTSAIVVLSNVGNAQRLKVRLTGIQPGNGTVEIPINVLCGDINGDGIVNILDMGRVRNLSGQPVNSTSYKFDTNADGAISDLDVAAIRLKSGASLPK